MRMCLLDYLGVWKGHSLIHHLIQHSVLKHKVEHLGLVLVPLVSIIVPTLELLFHLEHKLLRVHVIDGQLLLMVVSRRSVWLRLVQLLIVRWNK